MVATFPFWKPFFSRWFVAGAGEIVGGVCRLEHGEGEQEEFRLKFKSGLLAPSGKWRSGESESSFVDVFEAAFCFLSDDEVEEEEHEEEEKAFFGFWTGCSTFCETV